MQDAHRAADAAHDGAVRRRIDFDGGGAFYADLKLSVTRLLAEPGRARRAQIRMYAKSGVVVAWAVASWLLLVFGVPQNWWQAGLLAVSLGLALAGIGFNIPHDANHGAYSPHRRLNRVMRWSLDLLGASSYVWRTKHNVVHHTYTNISGADSDIDSMPFARLRARPAAAPRSTASSTSTSGRSTGSSRSSGTRRRLRLPARGPDRRHAAALAPRAPAGRLLARQGRLRRPGRWCIPLLLHPAWQVAVVFLRRRRSSWRSRWP